jgi:hypothetical protein
MGITKVEFCYGYESNGDLQCVNELGILPFFL